MNEVLDWKARVLSSIRAHKLAKPLKVVKDSHGCTWLCDADVDENQDLAEQGCWRCGSASSLGQKKGSGSSARETTGRAASGGGVNAGHDDSSGSLDS